MNFTRRLRKRVTHELLRWGQELARTGDYRRVERLRELLRRAAKAALPLRKRLARNMKLAGVYQAHLIDAHFERAIDQLIMIAHVFRAGFAQSGCPERFAFDGSFELLRRAYAKGKGVICIAPHICGYPLYPRIANSRIPCVIYLRQNKDPYKMHINQLAGEAGGAELVYPPAGATKAQRLQVAVDVLRQGKTLFVCADTPRKPDQGVPVSIFSRTAYFPTGVFIMSLRTGAPVVPVSWHWRAGQYHIRYDEPIQLSRGGALQRKAEAAVQQWAQNVNTYLYRYPEMWWNWLDKRWTKIIRDGHPRVYHEAEHSRRVQLGPSPAPMEERRSPRAG